MMSEKMFYIGFAPFRPYPTATFRRFPMSLGEVAEYSLPLVVAETFDHCGVDARVYPARGIAVRDVLECVQVALNAELPKMQGCVRRYTTHATNVLGQAMVKLRWNKMIGGQQHQPLQMPDMISLIDLLPIFYPQQGLRYQDRQDFGPDKVKEVMWAPHIMMDSLMKRRDEEDDRGWTTWMLALAKFARDN
jgi:hypothetical protein